MTKNRVRQKLQNPQYASRKSTRDKSQHRGTLPLMLQRLYLSSVIGVMSATERHTMQYECPEYLVSTDRAGSTWYQYID